MVVYCVSNVGIRYVGVILSDVRIGETTFIGRPDIGVADSLDIGIGSSDIGV